MNGCIEYSGCKGRTGYGQMMRGGRRWSAHRWSWTQTNGPIPPGMCVLHRCDNPPCINVDHLFLGTPADNARDRAAKNRNGSEKRAGDRNGMRLHPERVLRGESNANARLTEDAVRSIRERLAQGQTQKAVARTFGVSRALVYGIATGRAWAHVA